MRPEDSSADVTHNASVTSEAVTSAEQCSTMPGYGWENGVSVPCELGYYAPGYDNQVCVGAGFHPQAGVTPLSG